MIQLSSDVEAIISEDAKAEAFCISLTPDISFTTYKGRRVTGSSMLAAVLGLKKGVHPAGRFLRDQRQGKRDPIEYVDLHQLKIEDRGVASELANLLGMSSKGLGPAFANSGGLTLYAAPAVAILALTEAKRRSQLPSELLDGIQDGKHGRIDLFKASAELITKAEKRPTREVEKKVLKPQIVKLKKESGNLQQDLEGVAIVDASMSLKRNRGCSYAIFLPSSGRAYTRYYEEVWPIHLVEAQAIAQAWIMGQSKQVYSDCKMAQEAFLKGKKELQKMGDIRENSNEEYYVMRQLIEAGGLVNWLPRERNMIADRIAKYGAFHHYTGWLNVEFSENINFKYPPPNVAEMMTLIREEETSPPHQRVEVEKIVEVETFIEVEKIVEVETFIEVEKIVEGDNSPILRRLAALEGDIATILNYQDIKAKYSAHQR